MQGFKHDKHLVVFCYIFLVIKSVFSNHCFPKQLRMLVLICLVQLNASIAF